MSNPEYLKLADAIAADIAAGVLKRGDRLPPQRDFAYKRKIAVSRAVSGESRASFERTAEKRARTTCAMR